RALLSVAAHQIEYSRNVAEATVHAAVDAARLLGAQRATGLTNAALRRFVAERASLLARVDEQLPARTAHPAWLVQQIAGAWPGVRSEEHTSELQSQSNLVCRLLLEKKKKK